MDSANDTTDRQMEEAVPETDQEATQEIGAADVMDQRSRSYALLSRLYRSEIDQELLDELHGMLYPKDTGYEDVDEGHRLIATYLSNLWEDSLTELSVDYARCFIGTGSDAYAAAYPYESVYTSPKRLMMQNARDEVLAIYRSQGIEKAADWTEGEDHIALELEFESILASRAADALRSGDDSKAEDSMKVQLNFLEDHLCAWVPMMTHDLKRFARTKMYQGLAYLTDGFLQSDLDLMQDLLGAEDVQPS